MGALGGPSWTWPLLEGDGSMEMNQDFTFQELNFTLRFVRSNTHTQAGRPYLLRSIDNSWSGPLGAGPADVIIHLSGSHSNVGQEAGFKQQMQLLKKDLEDWTNGGGGRVAIVLEVSCSPR